MGWLKLLAKLEVFKLLALWDEKRQIIITCGTWRSYLGRECERNNNVSLLGPWFLVSGKDVGFSSQAYLLQVFDVSLLRETLSDQKCNACSVEPVLPLISYPVFYYSHIVLVLAGLTYIVLVLWICVQSWDPSVWRLCYVRCLSQLWSSTLRFSLYGIFVQCRIC